MNFGKQRLGVASGAVYDFSSVKPKKLFETQCSQLFVLSDVLFGFASPCFYQIQNGRHSLVQLQYNGQAVPEFEGHVQ